MNCQTILRAALQGRPLPSLRPIFQKRDGLYLGHRSTAAAKSPVAQPKHGSGELDKAVGDAQVVSLVVQRVSRKASEKKVITTSLLDVSP